MTDQKIDWNDVESAEAREDGLHIKKKDGTLGVLAVQIPQGANWQRQTWCKSLYDTMNTLSQHLSVLLTNQDKPGTPSLIVTTKQHIKELQDLIRSTGC